MKKLFICVLILLQGLFIFACDDTTGPFPVIDDDIPAITGIQVQPQNINFDPETDGFKDTTLTIGIYVSTINTSDDLPPRFIITDKATGEEISSGNFDKDLTDSRTGNFGVQVELETATTSFSEYIINAFPMVESRQGNFAQTTFKVTGISNNPPEILEINNPSEVQIPASGTQSVSFIAKVTDRDGQDTIEEVFMRLISRSTGEVDSPFPLYDDGTQGGDITPNDSLYTLTFSIDNENQPDTYDLEYYAIDEAGLSSDTTSSTFRITE
ncbi:MAG: hypothetical protein WD357_03395 [Gracilimonas sp.]